MRSNFWQGKDELIPSLSLKTIIDWMVSYKTINLMTIFFLQRARAREREVFSSWLTAFILPCQAKHHNQSQNGISQKKRIILLSDFFSSVSRGLTICNSFSYAARPKLAPLRLPERGGFCVFTQLDTSIQDKREWNKTNKKASFLSRSLGHFFSLLTFTSMAVRQPAILVIALNSVPAKFKRG